MDRCITYHTESIVTLGFFWRWVEHVKLCCGVRGVGNEIDFRCSLDSWNRCGVKWTLYKLMRIVRAREHHIQELPNFVDIA
jgi:hypothetical protein